jgi:hypothetical protein
MTPTWVKSNRCDTNACTEVADLGGEVGLRNSDDPDGPVVPFSKETWANFLAAVRDGTASGEPFQLD